VTVTRLPHDDRALPPETAHPVRFRRPPPGHRPSPARARHHPVDAGIDAGPAAAGRRDLHPSLHPRRAAQGPGTAKGPTGAG